VVSADASAAGLPGRRVDIGATEPGLAEARRLWWRERVTPATLRRDGRRWTLWSAGVAATFGLPSLVLLGLSPWTLPVALLWSAHGMAVLLMQPRRGVRSVVAMGSERSAGRLAGADPGAEAAALGLLGDLLDHSDRELLQETGLALHRGALGVWLVGERGALMLRPGGRRVDAWCVRVAEPDQLPAGDRLAHLLLALREDEAGFATVANLGFSGASWRLRMPMPKRQRPALEAAREAARDLSSDRFRALPPIAPVG
jgi:hypothetical protein